MSMKSKLLLAAGAIGAGMTATPAMAEGLYFGGFVGAAAVDDTDLAGGALDLSFDTGYIVGGVIGTHVSDNVRLEGELSYLAASADCNGKCSNSVDTSALQILGNVWFDFGSDSQWQPYVGGGAGAVRAHYEDSSAFDTEEWGWAYQLGAGLRFGDHKQFDLGYRFRGVNVDFDDFGDSFETNAHVIQFAWTTG